MGYSGGSRYGVCRMMAVLMVAALLAPCQGCATVRNTRVPEAYSEVGLCGKCKRLMALDGIADTAACACPNCGAPIQAGQAKYNFRRKCADKKNLKSAISCLSVAMLAGSIAGSIYGIPIPPPPMDANTFTPYELPPSLRCRQAVPADAPPVPCEALPGQAGYAGAPGGESGQGEGEER